MRGTQDRDEDLADARAAIVGVSGPALTDDEAALLQAHPPAGAILFARNVVDPPQLRALTAALRAVLPAGAVLMVDQEGGRVARLRPPHWRAHPPAGALGALHARDAAAGARAAWITGALIGADCRDAGFDVVCAPVLDRRVPGAHDVIGDRAFSDDVTAIAVLARAMADGLLAAGVQPVGKHAPGHGRAGCDSHLDLPRVAATPNEDLAPFQALAAPPFVLPWLMSAHILYEQWDAGRPGTVSPAVIGGVIRGRIGFSGVIVSDDLAMKALRGPPDALALAALAAGCDLALECSGDIARSRAVLQACPALTDAARAALARGRALAAERARARDGRAPHPDALDPAALAAERDWLMAA